MVHNTQDSNKALTCGFLVIKIASRCNLNCSYCFMYNLGDETYKNQPKVMDRGVAVAMLQRIRTHCLKHQLDSIILILHGGEPLLAGKEFYKNFVADANDILLPEVQPIFTTQTNGVLIDQEWCELFAELNVNVGISLDGTKAANDRYRLDHAGRSSYNKVVEGLQAALQTEALKNKPGLLSVIDIHSDPIEVYEHLLGLNSSGIEFLLPDATHDQPPPGLENDDGICTPYADWLIPIFDRWWAEPSEQRSGIRFFETIIMLLLGVSNGLDTIGVNENRALVIETDGGMEPVDSMKICGHGFTKVGANVLNHEIDEAYEDDLAKLYHLSGQMLCGICEECPVQDICAGGYLPHRFSRKNGFNNPSVFCRDLMKLCPYIQNKLFNKLSADAIKEIGIDIINYEETKAILAQNIKGKKMSNPELEKFGVPYFNKLAQTYGSEHYQEI